MCKFSVNLLLNSTTTSLFVFTTGKSHRPQILVFAVVDSFEYFTMPSLLTVTRFVGKSVIKFNEEVAALCQ